MNMLLKVLRKLQGTGCAKGEGLARVQRANGKSRALKLNL